MRFNAFYPPARRGPTELELAGTILGSGLAKIDDRYQIVVVLHINNGRSSDVHVQLDTVLPPETQFHDVIELDGVPHVVTGLRSPPSDFVTVRPKETI